jgi:predicted membrane protein (TIGR00267 family)
MGVSYAIGSLIPIVAFLLPVSTRWSIGVALGLAVLALFAVGWYAGTLASRNPIRKGLELAGYGCAIFLLSYLVGRFVPPLFGHAPLAIG